MNNLAQKYNAPVPRYTSYPTSPHFTPKLDKDIYAGWLNQLNADDPISLYLHVPFCRKMCWYCGCHTKITNQYDPIANYAAALREEVQLLVKALPARFKVSHIHWGGGTPSIFSAEDFKSIMEMIKKHFDYTDTAERAIEIDPRTVDAAKIKALAEGGINRASLGVQDFNPKVQAAINRVQSFDVTKLAVDNLRANGINNLNFDLMYGLPLQTTEHVKETVRLSHMLKPDRIALFGYAHVPWMKSHMKMIKDDELPGTEERVSQAKTAASELLKLGYIQVGLDHFARPEDSMSEALENNDLHRNFQGYTTDSSETLIGLGASSIGKLPQGYAQNVVSIHEYERQVRNKGFAVAKGIGISIEDKVRREVIERLMCDLEVDLVDVTAKYDLPSNFFDLELTRLKEFEEDNLLVRQENALTVTEEGRYLVRSICAVFDTYLGNGTGRHSRAV
ncbi:MAG: oxygen-independent coproporphyrinogen III oxidase [Sneathiella sp.]